MLSIICVETHFIFIVLLMEWWGRFVGSRILNTFFSEILRLMILKFKEINCVEQFTHIRLWIFQNFKLQFELENIEIMPWTMLNAWKSFEAVHLLLNVFRGREVWDFVAIQTKVFFRNEKLVTKEGVSKKSIFYIA